MAPSDQPHLDPLWSRVEMIRKAQEFRASVHLLERKVREERNWADPNTYLNFDQEVANIETLRVAAFHYAERFDER